MKLAIIALAGLTLSACSTVGGGGASGLGAGLQAIITDPSCAHHDEAEGITGAAGIPASLHFKVVRDCQAKAITSDVTVAPVVTTASVPPN